MTSACEQGVAPQRVACSVYKSRKKADTYVYVPRDADLTKLPAGLLAVFGEPEFVFDLELYPGRTLAQEDVIVVMRNMLEQGYHLQMPQREYVGLQRPF